MENFITLLELNKTRKMMEKVLDELKPHPLPGDFGRMIKGTKQVAALWREEDGNLEEFQDFCIKHFIVEEKELVELFERFENHLEQINGHLHELSTTLSAPVQVARFKEMKVDELFSTFNPAVHLVNDLFKTKLAFVALLNFGLYSLEERLRKGPLWSRKQWALARLMSYFSERVSAKAVQEIEKAQVEADNYINHNNFYVENIEVSGKKLFEGLPKLISHWGLRDHIKALYPSPDPILAQRTLYEVMIQVVDQTVPRKVIDNPKEIWDPFTDGSTPEPNTRYEKLLNIFKAVQAEDKERRENKTLIDRRFNEDREIPEKQVEKWLVNFLSSPVAKKVGEYISHQLGRPLEPFDIWFNQFSVKSEVEELNDLVRKKYPTIEALESFESEILKKLGFGDKIAAEIASKVKLDPGRSAGHATGAERREGEHRIRLRIPEKDGKFVPDYTTFNIFMHEFGHGVEMFFSVHRMDHAMLFGVPNTAFTEALAFVFQEKDLEILGVREDDNLGEARKHLALFWNTFEIAGVSLVDLRIWQWMYANPEATAESLKNATVKIAKDVWNQYFSPIFGHRDQQILAIYSHIIDCLLYIPDYFIGSIIQHQLQEYFKDKNLANEVERIFTLGNLTPDLWMKKAIGNEISIEPLLESAEEALEKLKH